MSTHSTPVGVPGSSQIPDELHSIGSTRMQLDIAISFRQGEVIPSVPIEIRTTQTTPQKPSPVEALMAYVADTSSNCARP